MVIYVVTCNNEQCKRQLQDFCRNREVRLEWVAGENTLQCNSFEPRKTQEDMY